MLDLILGSSYLQYVVIAAIALIGGSYIWPYLKDYLTKITSKTTTATTDVKVISDDELAARTALQEAALLFEKHEDAEVSATLKSFVVKAVAWSGK
jgi:hypothetical protein